MADNVFEHPRLAAIYDALDPDRSDFDAYLAIADEIDARYLRPGREFVFPARRPQRDMAR